MQGSSRSKPIMNRSLEVHHPGVPILDTEDLPIDDGWGLMRSFAVDLDAADDMDSDRVQPAIVSGDFD